MRRKMISHLIEIIFSYSLGVISIIAVPKMLFNVKYVSVESNPILIFYAMLQLQTPQPKVGPQMTVHNPI